MENKPLAQVYSAALDSKAPASATKGGGLAGGLETALRHLMECSCARNGHDFEFRVAMDRARAALASGATPPDDVD